MHKVSVSIKTLNVAHNSSVHRDRVYRDIQWYSFPRLWFRDTHQSILINCLCRNDTEITFSDFDQVGNRNSFVRTNRLCAPIWQIVFSIKMKWLLFSVIHCCLSVVLCANIIDSNVLHNPASVNDAPIVGVLAQELGHHLNSKWPGAYSSYIAASYIKFIEGGGARAVPIW